jgi:hypothetical protein
MLRNLRPLALYTALILTVALAISACPRVDNAKKQAQASAEQAKAGEKAEAEAARRAKIALEFPLFGLVTGLQPTVRAQPTAESLTVGWLRIGSEVRLAPGPVKSPTCNTGWYRIYPSGWACAGEGIQVEPGAPKPAPETEVEVGQKDPGLPYFYYFVKEPFVPAYHRLPPRDDQRLAEAFAQRYIELKKESEEKAARLLRGELANEPQKPSIVAKYLDRGFFIAGSGIEVRASRRFVRMVRGQYIKLSQLQERHGSSFRGVELGKARTLPVAWVVRAAQPFWVKMRPDGSLKLVSDQNAQPIPRLTVLSWTKRERVGEDVFYRIEDGRYLKYWYVAVAEKIDPPKGIKEDEPWVHVNISQQTLVVYRGKEPIFATLVSTGLEGHDTPVGSFTIREKYLADTMSDLGPDAGDNRYKIEDVPWTQYFSRSVALHGAFWHEGYGLKRSHGCVNLSPLDARWVFEHTLPELPEGWHGISTDKTGFKGSTVIVTK